MKVVTRLWKRLKKYRLALLLLFFLVVVADVLSLLTPLLSGYAVDAIVDHPSGVDFAGVFRNCALMIACYALSAGLSYLTSVRLIRLGQDISFDLRQEVFRRLSSLPVSYFDTHPAGDVISRICYDIDTVNATISTDLLQVCTSVVTVVGSIVMLLSISPVLCLVFAVTVPISMIFSKRQMKKLQPKYRKRSAMLGEMNGFVEENVAGQKTVRAYGREDAMVALFDKKNEAATEAFYRADYDSCILGPMVNFINNLSLSFISVFGATLYLLGRLSLGSLSSFVLYSRKFSGPIREAANILSELQAAAAAAERVFDLIDAAPEPPDAPDALPLDNVSGHVRFDDVSFGYTKARTVLADLNVDVKAGSLVAIVGPTGAGKTTIVNLLMRFYDADRGSITVDGVNVKKRIRADLRRAYAMVLQETWLFYGTIFENIAYGRAGATMEEVVTAAKAAHIHDYILSLPQGYDTLLTDDGVNVSKGQKQLLTIARAMLIDANMLILDEATSNLDTGTELDVNAAMEALMRGKTCFVIAHRLSTIQNADTILVISDGRLVEQGTHASLLAAGGVYAELYRSQFVIQ